MTIVCVCVSVNVSVLSRVQLFATPWTVACQAPLSMGFPRQEYWSGCHFLLQGILLPAPPPPPGIKPASPVSAAWQEDSLPLSHQEAQDMCIA